jgi:hypothetical protein
MRDGRFAAGAALVVRLVNEQNWEQEPATMSHRDSGEIFFRRRVMAVSLASKRPPPSCEIKRSRTSDGRWKRSFWAR